MQAQVQAHLAAFQAPSRALVGGSTRGISGAIVAGVGAGVVTSAVAGVGAGMGDAVSSVSSLFAPMLSSINGSIRAVSSAATETVEDWMDAASVAVSESLTDFVTEGPLASISSAVLSTPARPDARTLMTQPIQVVVRLHPERAPLGRRSARLTCANGAIRVAGSVRGASPTMYQLDAVLEEGATQSVAYSYGVAHLVPRLLAGRRCAVLFVGPSAAGKSHTAFGSPAALEALAYSGERGDDAWGAAPRASREIFEALGESVGAAGPLELSVSWYEVRGEQIVDLLRAVDAPTTAPMGERAHGRRAGSPGAQHGARRTGGTSGRGAAPPPLRIRETPAAGPHVKGVSRHVVERHDQVLALLALGSRRRARLAGPVNLHASAGTAFFSLYLRSKAALKRSSRDAPSATDPCLTIVDVAAESGGTSPAASSRPPPSFSSQRRGSPRRSPSPGRGAPLHSHGAGVAVESGRLLLGPSHAALMECTEALLASQARGESSSALGPTFRRHPVTRLLAPCLLGECTTAAVACCNVGDAELPATLAALRLAVMLRSSTTRVAPSVQPLLPPGPVLPSAETALVEAPTDFDQDDQYGDHYGAQNGDQYGAQYGDQYGAQNGDQYGAQYGDQYGAQYGDQYGAQYGDQYGAQHYRDQYGAQYGDQYGAQYGDQYGDQYGAQYGDHGGDQYGGGASYPPEGDQYGGGASYPPEGDQYGGGASYPPEGSYYAEGGYETPYVPTVATHGYRPDEYERWRSVVQGDAYRDPRQARLPPSSLPPSAPASETRSAQYGATFEPRQGGVGGGGGVGRSSSDQYEDSNWVGNHDHVEPVDRRAGAYVAAAAPPAPQQLPPRPPPLPPLPPALRRVTVGGRAPTPDPEMALTPEISELRELRKKAAALERLLTEEAERPPSPPGIVEIRGVRPPLPPAPPLRAAAVSPPSRAPAVSPPLRPGAGSPPSLVPLSDAQRAEQLAEWQMLYSIAGKE